LHNAGIGEPPAGDLDTLPGGLGLDLTVGAGSFSA
jgi:hypothetical protein